MSAWLLLLWILLTWFFGIVACAAGKAVGDARRGVPKSQRHGVSFAPIIVLPLSLWGLALLIDLAVEPWGTLVIGIAHGLLLLALVASIIRSFLILRSLEQDA